VKIITFINIIKLPLPMNALKTIALYIYGTQEELNAYTQPPMDKPEMTTDENLYRKNHIKHNFPLHALSIVEVATAVTAFTTSSSLEYLVTVPLITDLFVRNIPVWGNILNEGPIELRGMGLYAGIPGRIRSYLGTKKEEKVVEQAK
jgi:hypothetical protein